MAKVSNRDVHKYVAERKEFMNNNGTMFAQHDLAANTYTVYSYGQHYPMYVYDYETLEWWGNETKDSRTTSRHMTQARPPCVAQWTDTHTLQDIAAHGVVHAVGYRMAA